MLSMGYVDWHIKIVTGTQENGNATKEKKYRKYAIFIAKFKKNTRFKSYKKENHKNIKTYLISLSTNRIEIIFYLLNYKSLYSLLLVVFNTIFNI